MAPHLVNRCLPTRARLCRDHVRAIVEHGRQMTSMRLPGTRRAAPRDARGRPPPTTGHGRSDHGEVAHRRHVYQAAPIRKPQRHVPATSAASRVLRGDRNRSTTPPGLPRPGSPPSHVHTYGRRTPRPEGTTRTTSPELLPARSDEHPMTCDPAAPRRPRQWRLGSEESAAELHGEPGVCRRAAGHSQRTAEHPMSRLEPVRTRCSLLLPDRRRDFDRCRGARTGAHNRLWSREP